MNIDKMESTTHRDDRRRIPDSVDLPEVCGVPVYVTAIEVCFDTPDTLFAVGPYDEELRAACLLAKTSSPQTVRSQDGRQWLFLFSNVEAT